MCVKLGWEVTQTGIFRSQQRGKEKGKKKKRERRAKVQEDLKGTGS